MANRGPRNWWILIPAIVLAIFFGIVLIFRSDQARTTTTTVLLGVGIAGCIATALLEFLSPSGAGGGTDLGLSDLQLRRDDVAGMRPHRRSGARSSDRRSFEELQWSRSRAS